ncbi:hypothetical protein [Alkaliphilus transvaalensis]|nr:hypothetical protein [Alkaliphilus transvaalensis]
MNNDKINSLKDLIIAYGNQKTDQEISQLLDIPLDKVKDEREKVTFQTVK